MECCFNCTDCVKLSISYDDMMYIILLIYFVNIVCGDDSSETKYIDLLPEKEKEEFLETVARRIFDNIKHKNAIPETDEHTKLIEKVLKEESLNLKRVSRNISDDSDDKGNVVEEDGDAFVIKREGKRNKRNSLKENKNSHIIHVQGASKETNTANFNELSKELRVSDTEDIEVKPSNNIQTEIDNEEITTQSNEGGKGYEVTVGDSILKENGSVQDDANNKPQEEKHSIKPPTSSKHERIMDTNADISKITDTVETIEPSYSTTEKINVNIEKNTNPDISELTNDSSEKEQVPIVLSVKTSLSTSSDDKLMKAKTEGKGVEYSSKSSLAFNTDSQPTESKKEKRVIENAISAIVSIRPDANVTETTTESSIINETRKSYDKLATNFDTANITSDDIPDDVDNDGSKAAIDITMKIKTGGIDNVKLDGYNSDNVSTDTTMYENNNYTSINDLVSLKKYHKTVTDKANSMNSVTERRNKDTKSINRAVLDTDNSNENILKVIKNSKDFIKNKHSIKVAINDYKVTTALNYINSITNNSDIVARDPEVINTPSMGIPINDNKEINMDTSKEKIQNKSDGITDRGLQAEANIQINKMNNGTEIVSTTNMGTPIGRHKETKIQDNTEAELENGKNITEAKYDMVTGSYDENINYDKTAEKTESNSSVFGFDKNIAVDNNKSRVKEIFIDTSTVKIETLTVPIEINHSGGTDDISKIKEEKKYLNQDKISKTPVTESNHESAKVSSFNDNNKMDKNLEKIEIISANFVNDMLKILRGSFSSKSNNNLKNLRLLDNNPKPKEYKVYRAPNNEPLDQRHDAKDEKLIKENPYYVPVYNYGPEHAYYNPRNRLGPNADDDDVTIIKTDANNVDSIAHDYDSIIKDSYNENYYTKSNYNNRQNSDDNDAKNDVDYDDAYNKEKEFIDRMDDIGGDYIFNQNENLRGRDTEYAQKVKKVEHMKNLVKVYKNHKNRNNKHRSFGRYKLNLPIVVNYPKYSDIIMNSHDYLDIDYRYPRWNKPKNSKSRKHRIIRTNGSNNIIITSFADDPHSSHEGHTIGDLLQHNHDEYKDDSNMLFGETHNHIQEKEKLHKIIYDDDYGEYVKKPYENHYGKPNSINLFESEEYVWETQDTKEKRKKKKGEDEKSLGVKNKIRKIREMMYSSANFGFIKPKKVEKNNNNRLKFPDFIKNVPKLCDSEDPSCVEPFLIIKNKQYFNRKQADSLGNDMNNSLTSDYFNERVNNTSDFVVDYVPKLSARTKNFKFDSSMEIVDQNLITWIKDLSELRDEKSKTDCNFCSIGVCHTCVCGKYYKFCKIPETKPTDMTTPANKTELTETTTDNDIPKTVRWDWDTVKNISILPSYLDPILKKKDYNKHKQNNKKYLIFRSKDDKISDSIEADDGDKSPEDKNMEQDDKKPNIILLNPEDDQHEDYIHPLHANHEIRTTTTPKPVTKPAKKKYNKFKTLKDVTNIVPDDVELMLKVVDMLGNESGGDFDDGKKGCLRTDAIIDLESYVSVLDDMVRNEAKGLVQYDWMGTTIDIQAAIFKLIEMIDSVKNNEVLNHLDFKLLKYFTFLHKFSMKRQKDLRMILPKPKHKYNRSRSERGLYSRAWLKRRLKKFAYEVSGTDLFYFKEFLDELLFYLYDLHTALTQIATVTSYKNQHWFKNLKELYLDNSRKNILELLLHITTVRLLDLVENSAQTGLQDSFLRYVLNNEKDIEKSKNELLLILEIIEKLKK